MTVMNVVHMRVKPGMEAEYIRLHNNFDAKAIPGSRNFWLVKSGERSFIVIGEWDSMEAMAAARPQMIATLDSFRHTLEDQGGGIGLTDPVSGDVVLQLM